MNINDVAEAAGVSRGSVSNYLNNKKVSDKIKLKIEAAIKELNYIPNSSARDLRSKESKFVVFIIPTVWSPFFSELTYYIQNELNSSGYKMILCISDSDFNKEKEYIELATSQKAAGIISISYSQMNDFVRPGMPLVSIEKEPTGRFSMVSSDNYEGGKLAAQKLIEKGAETLIYSPNSRLPGSLLWPPVARGGAAGVSAPAPPLSFLHSGRNALSGASLSVGPVGWSTAAASARCLFG